MLIIRPNPPSFPVTAVQNGPAPHPVGWVALTDAWLNPKNRGSAELQTSVQGLETIKVEEDRYALGKIRKWLEFADYILRCNHTAEE